MDWIVPFAVCFALVWAQHHEAITAWWRRVVVGDRQSDLTD